MHVERRWKMKHKGIIFDMDGILFDTERIYQETWAELADEHGVELDENFAAAVSGSNGEHLCKIIEAYYNVDDGAPVVADCMTRMRSKLEREVPLKTGVREILEYFKEKNLCIAVASSNSAPQIEHNLITGGIREYFSEIVSGDDVDHGKPFPDIFLLASERLGLEPAECIVFEDSKNGVKAGHAAGCYTIMIPDVVQPDEEILSICDKKYKDFFEVIAAQESEL